jgi:L,D-transpeptidase catalytic domain
MRRHAVILALAAWLVGVESAEARLDILVDKATQRMLVIQDGYMRYIWPVSTGRDELATPNGVYAPQRMERNWFSRAYYNSPMPNSIFFHNGYAIHGSYAIDQLGGPASHGCVRLHPHHAALLFDLVQQEGPDKTTIEITDQPRPDEPPMASRDVLPPREIAMGRNMDDAPVPPREVLPPREIAIRRSVDTPPVPPREVLPPREIAMRQGSYPPASPPEILSPREIAMGRNVDPPPIVRYRDPVDLAELSPSQRGIRSIGPRAVPPARPPIGRRMLTDLRPPPNTARTPCDAAKQGSDCRPKAKVAEAPLPEQPQQTQQPQQAQPAQGISSFKLLPASCWSGGASRWRWWASGREAACK